MGVAKLDEVRRELLAGGLAPSTPVAMIENASLPHQRECRSVLSTMDQAALAFELKAPAVIVIGEVVSQGYLRELHASMSA